MNIEMELDNSVREYFRRNNNRPMPHGLFSNETKVNVYQAAIKSGMDHAWVQEKMYETVKLWERKGLCLIHDELTGDIEFTTKGYTYFTS